MTHRPAKKFTATIAGISALALVLTACSSGSTSSTTTSATSAESSAAESEPAASGSSAAEPAGPASATSDWCDRAKALGDITGKSVGIYTTITGTEADAYVESYKAFTECTGATVQYENSKDFEAQVIVRVQSGNPPDVAIFPQPGLLNQIVQDTGAVKPITPELEEFALQFTPQSWLDFGRVNDIPFGLMNNVDFKSLVWYSPAKFKELGLTVPTTWEELTALYEGVAGNGQKPWCIGIGSGEATGWQITDWLEEYVLRTAGPDVYDQWVTNEVKFADPKIADALAQVGAILKDPKYVNAGFGDVNTIASTAFQDPAGKVLSGECLLTRQAANFDAFFPAGTTFGPDGQVDAFYFPPITEEFGTTVLGGGTLYAAFTDRPEVQAFQYFAASPEYANARAKAGSYISANRGLDVKNASTPILQTALETLQQEDTVFRFDASDLMPAPVGSAAEWTEFTKWITGQDDATTLANIDAAWPAS